MSAGKPFRGERHGKRRGLEQALQTPELRGHAERPPATTYLRFVPQRGRSVQRGPGGLREMLVELREVKCRWACCTRVFRLCRGCDRGRRYCCEECRNKAREASVRAARKEYARSDRGRECNRERQRRYRARRSAQLAPKADSVTDHSSRKAAELASWVDAAASSVERPEGREVHFAKRDRGLQVMCALRASSAEPRVLSTGPAPSSARSQRVEVGRCSLCGCWGVVVRRVTKRGRFRMQ